LSPDPFVYEILEFITFLDLFTRFVFSLHAIFQGRSRIILVCHRCWIMLPRKGAGIKRFSDHDLIVKIGLKTCEKFALNLEVV
jgi:hypothetical protein